MTYTSHFLNAAFEHAFHTYINMYVCFSLSESYSCIHENRIHVNAWITNTNVGTLIYALQLKMNSWSRLSKVDYSRNFSSWCIKDAVATVSPSQCVYAIEPHFTVHFLRLCQTTYYKIDNWDCRSRRETVMCNCFGIQAINLCRKVGLNIISIYIYWHFHNSNYEFQLLIMMLLKRVTWYGWSQFIH